MSSESSVPRSENYDADDESGCSGCPDTHSNPSRQPSPLDFNGRRYPPSLPFILSSTRLADFSVRHYSSYKESGDSEDTSSLSSAWVTETDDANDTAEEQAAQKTQHCLTEENLARLPHARPSVYELMSGCRQIYRTAEEIEAARLERERAPHVEWEELRGPFGPDYRSPQPTSSSEANSGDDGDLDSAPSSDKDFPGRRVYVYPDGSKQITIPATGLRREIIMTVAAP
ncbi:MAG: hypothetical protein LQ341_007444 [Variospora aurantia]|nr:MAG: hypothetical protein LQ341_007444 [Variospora aurantia]